MKKLENKIDNVRLADIQKAIYAQYLYELNGEIGKIPEYEKFEKENPMMVARMISNLFKLALD